MGELGEEGEGERGEREERERGDTETEKQTAKGLAAIRNRLLRAWQPSETDC